MAGFLGGTCGAKPDVCRFLGSRGGVLMSVMLRPATASEIIEICGYLDDGVVTRILATGASPAEVIEGFTWATADDQIGTELRHGRVKPSRTSEASPGRRPTTRSAPNCAMAGSAPAAPR